MKKSGIEDINKNFNEEYKGSYETYYSPATKQWEQREIVSGSPHKVGNIGTSKLQDQQIFQKQNNGEPQSINKSKIDFLRVNDKRAQFRPLVQQNIINNETKNQSKCKYISLVIIGILVLGAIAGTLSYFFYIKPKYLRKNQLSSNQNIQSTIASFNANQTVQSQVLSTWSALSDVLKSKQYTNNKHLQYVL